MGRRYHRLPAATRFRTVVVSLLVLAASAAAAQQPGRLTVTVVDPSAAVVVAATVALVPADDPGRVVTRATDARGEARFDVRVGGAYRLRADATGFSRRELDLRVTRADARQRVELALAPVAVDVLVRREPEVAATDPRGLAFRRVLTERDLAALPEDPEALEQALRAIAGPGAVFRVDGFSANRLPPKSAIQEIRISYSEFSAEYHVYTRAVVDILTKPGIERFSGSFGVRAGPSAWSARDAFASRRGESDLRSYEGSLGGPLWRERTSFLATLTVATQEVEQPVSAMGPAGPIQDQLVQANSNAQVWASVVHALAPGQTTRARYTERRSDADNSGVGGLALAERAVHGELSDRTLLWSLTGPVGTRLYNQIRVRLGALRSHQEAASDAPAVEVIGAFEGGGAQVGGGRRQTRWAIEDDLDLTWRNHAIRAGVAGEAVAVRSDEWRNRGGTYLFASLDDFVAGRPLSFTRRRGDPFVTFSVRQGALYVQDDVRLGKVLTISAGARVEAQSVVRGAHLAPRFGLSWAPFKGGRTAVRLGVGRYYEWVPSIVVEQVARLDGSRQQEVVVVRPDPGVDPIPSAPPAPGRYLLSPDATLPRTLRFMTAVEQQLGPTATLTVTYEDVRVRGLLRGSNLNAPAPGVGRPDERVGNVIEAQSVGRRHEQSLSVRVNWRAPAPLDLLVLGNYTLGRARDDTDGPFVLPARPLALDDEWAPSRRDARHEWSVTGLLQSRSVCHGVFSVAGSSGTPYSIRTGFDENGDGLAIERPAGIGRNSMRGEGHLLATGRLACRPFRRASGRGASPGTRAPVFELSVEAQNFFNRTNPVGYVGVMSSPLFGRPVGSLPARRVSAGLSVRF